MDTTAEAGPAGHRDRVKALLSYVVECRLLGLPAGPPSVGVSSPWDVWWVCYRAAVPAETLGLYPRRTTGTCDRCVEEVAVLTAANLPRHPGYAGSSPCGCLNQWAISMRVPVPGMPWPALHLSLAMVKPGADTATVVSMLGHSYDHLFRAERMLTSGEVRRLYPDA